jgi:hypothetical protein
MNESSLVAYDYRESHKKSQLKIIKAHGLSVGKK